MHWSSVEDSGGLIVDLKETERLGLRSHTATLVSSKIFIYGGYDSNSIEDPNNDNHLLIFDTETMHLRRPAVSGTKPGCLRAHSGMYT
jgi:hypothetical protein